MSRRLFIALAGVALAAVSCGAGRDATPVGERMLPDLAPLAPIEMFTGVDEATGERSIFFTSVLVNVGEGDLLIDAERPGGLLDEGEEPEWTVYQRIPYTQAGFETVVVDAPMVWGGDGHSHWHVAGIARYWIEALDDDFEPTGAIEPRYDSKIGFCFYDTHVYQEDRPETPDEAVYLWEGCGSESDRTVSMGLSVGWGDTYMWTLPGQEIDITGLADGYYRVWGSADPQNWFVEASRENNETWVDIQLSTRERDSAPVVDVVRVGPDPLT